MAIKHVRYEGGFDKVTVFSPSSGLTLMVARGEVVALPEAEAGGLAESEWTPLSAKDGKAALAAQIADAIEPPSTESEGD